MHDGCKGRSETKALRRSSPPFIFFFEDGEGPPKRPEGALPASHFFFEVKQGRINKAGTSGQNLAWPEQASLW